MRATACAVASATLALAACGGSGSGSAEPDPASTATGASAFANVPDVSTIGESPSERWVRLADEWAEAQLDAGNTAGELLSDPQTRRAVVRGDGRNRTRVLRALRVLARSCLTRAALPPAPSGQEKADGHLSAACDAFEAAAGKLLPAIEQRRGASVPRGLEPLAGGVNEIARAYQEIAPLLG